MATMRWRLGRFAGAATLFALCVALAAAPTTLALKESTLDDACEELSSAKFVAILKCGSIGLYREDAYLCEGAASDYILTQVFLEAAEYRGYDPDDPAGKVVCALTEARNSLAGACNASRDALAASPANFTSLCEDAFKKLPSRSPSPPPPPPSTTPAAAKEDVSALADACKKLSSGRFDATLDCGSIGLYREDGSSCEYATGELVTFVFSKAADPEVEADDFIVGVRKVMCALMEAKNTSLAGACEASRDALAASPANLTSLCKDAFKKLPSAPPPPPPRPRRPCEDDPFRKLTCSEHFSQGTHLVKTAKLVRDTSVATGMPNNALTYDYGEWDCCEELDTLCLCHLKKTLTEQGNKNVSKVACLNGCP